MADDNVAIIDEITDRIMARLLAQQLLKEPKPKKKYRAWERKLAWEYMTKFYRNKPKWFRHEVGGLPQGKNDAIYAKVRRWADCIMIDDNRIVIIEFKMQARPSTVGQILTYGEMFKETPEFEAYRDWPVHLKIVTARTDEATAKMAERNGVELEIYKPEFFDEWFRDVIIARYKNKEEKK